LKILQIIQKPQLRGAEMFASQLANHLKQRGHVCKLVTIFPGEATLPFQGEHIRLDRPLKNRLWDFKGWKHLAKIIEQEKPDVIQANAGDTLKFVVLSKLIFRWKTPIFYRNANKVSDFIKSRSKLIFNRFLVDRVHHVISVSELCRQDFMKIYGFPERRTTMLPIGIELVRIDKSLSTDVRQYFQNGKVVVNVASLVPEKNHEGLLRIAREIIREQPDVKFLILGDGKLRSLLQTRITAMGLERHVFLLGYRNDVLSIMANADAFVLPSRVEGLPGVILEAFYCEVPVVAYNVGGISEVVQNNKTGWLVEKDREQDFVVALKEALTHQEKVTLMKKQAYELAMKDFTNANLAALFEKAYKQNLPLK
jgi:glycosyltransferase involved in cell wall biosynthesis